MYINKYVLQEDQQYIALPVVELQPDGRFTSNVRHVREEVQEENSNCKTITCTIM